MPTATTLRPMARIHQEKRVFPQPQAEVRRAAERAIVEAGLSLSSEATEYELKASRGINSGSWGERIRFIMATSPGGGTQVIIESKLTLGFFDWGRNKDNIESLFSSMEVVLGPGEIREINP